MLHERNGVPAEGTAEAGLGVRVERSSLEASLAEQAGERGMQGQSRHPGDTKNLILKTITFFKRLYYLFLFLGYECFACFCDYVSCVCSSYRSQKRESDTPITGVTDGFKLSCRC